MKSIIAAVLATLIATAALAAASDDEPRLSADDGGPSFATRLVYPPPPLALQGAWRRGLTLELALGAHYTNAYVDSSNRVAGVIAGSVGLFSSNDVAWLLHVAGTNTSQYVSETVLVDGQAHNGTRSHSITTLFGGPQAQWFPWRRLMFAAGVGAAGLIDAVRFDTLGTRERGSHATAGVGASLRAAFTVIQRREAASLRLGVEALPSYIGGQWRSSIGLMGELQIF